MTRAAQVSLLRWLLIMVFVVLGYFVLSYLASVLAPIPKGSGFTQPGRYITLTTCTPEFTSKYRLIVWGKMVEERPRSKGKPDALVE